MKYLLLDETPYSSQYFGFKLLFDSIAHTLADPEEFTTEITCRYLIYIAYDWSKLVLFRQLTALLPQAEVFLFFHNPKLIQKKETRLELLNMKLPAIMGCFASTYEQKVALAEILIFPVFELSIPVELSRLNSKFGQPKSVDALVISESPVDHIVLPDNFILFNSPDASDSITESRFIEMLSKARFVLLLDTHLCSDWVQVAAVFGTIVITSRYCETSFSLFPYTCRNFGNWDEVLDCYHAISNNSELHRFLSDSARSKAERFNVTNSREKLVILARAHLGIFLDLTTGASPSLCLSYAECIFPVTRQDNHIYSSRQFVVCCLLKDAGRFAHPWLQHYRNLGAAHFFIVDNGSTDGTTEFFASESDISLFKTNLSFKHFEADIRRYIIEKYCQLTWCLTVDIDEFFAYPRSDILSMESFLDYLNSNRFTAVSANMLDMFHPGEVDSEDFQSTNIYYDLSNVRINHYNFLVNRFHRYNTNYDKNLTFCYGGVRAKDHNNSQSVKPVLLLKHPLTFQNGTLTPQIDPHFCDKANIADVSCVLLHHKLAPFNKHITLQRATDKIFNYHANEEYQNYLETNKNHGKIYYSNNPQILGTLEELHQSKFLYYSNRFIKYLHKIRK